MVNVRPLGNSIINLIKYSQTLMVSKRPENIFSLAHISSGIYDSLLFIRLMSSIYLWETFYALEEDLFLKWHLKLWKQNKKNINDIMGYTAENAVHYSFTTLTNRYKKFQNNIGIIYTFFSPCIR